MLVPAAAAAQPSGQADPPAWDAPPAEPAPAEATRPELHLGAGVGFVRRAFDYDINSGARSRPPAVHSTAPELQIDGDIYPFAIADRHSPVANLGFALTYDQAMGSSVESDAMSRDIDQSYFSVGPRYRFNLDDRSAITVGLDYVHQQYIVEHSYSQSQIAGVPDIAYSAIAPTITGRFGVAPNTALLASLAGWLVVDAGQITDLDQYGKSRVLGLTAMAGAEFAFSPRVNLSILFQYRRVSLDFDGVGAMSNNLDGDPTTRDVTGAVDETVGVVATLGLQY